MIILVQVKIPHNFGENGKKHSVHERFTCICLSVEQSIFKKYEIIKLIIRNHFCQNEKNL